MHQRGKHPLAMDVYLHRRLICFPSNLHVTGFSSCRITAMIHSYLVWFLWWLRHGAIGPSEATLFGVNVDWIDVRIYTFELVIRLSNAKQLALRFSAILRLPAAPDVPGIPVICTLSSEAVPNFRNLFLAAIFAATLHHVMTQEPGRRTTCRCGAFSFWFSGEVKHIVHLIRWNLKAVYANWGKNWPRSQTGNNARLLGS